MTETDTHDAVAALRDRLSAVSGEGLSSSARLALVGELEALAAAVFAAQARVAVTFAAAEAESIGEQLRARAARDARGIPPTSTGIARLAHRSVVSQLGLALHTSPYRARHFLALASRMASGALAGCADGATAGVLSREKVETLDRALAPVLATRATLDPEALRELELRLAALGERLGVRELERAARTAVADADPAAVVAQLEAAVSSRRVSVRPAPDGMARLSVLGPLADVVGAYAALVRSADTAPADARSRGQILCDTALERLSGRSPGEKQAVEIQLVMTDATLFAGGDRPAQVPGWGPVPAAEARRLALVPDDETGAAQRWIRRLFTAPMSGDLVALESTRRLFAGGLRRFTTLRDQTCRTPFCDAPVRHVDHVERAADGGPTSAANAGGLCEHCNLAKESPGWRWTVLRDGLDGRGPHEMVVTTPTGTELHSQAPPILGWGSPPPDLPECPDECTDEGWLSDDDVEQLMALGLLPA